MPALVSTLRKTLESTVVDARDKAERGARDALMALAVGASEPFASMSEEERKLRNRLRAHGRQLGDQRDPQKGSQSIERLVREMAYEHWHRMLFARFLAENQLLIEPTSGVSISLDECEELAAEEGTDLWGLAAQFAQAMLPHIFRVDDPVLTAKLPLETQLSLREILNGLEREIFTSIDGLGWSYQFWQSKQKALVNEKVKSGTKVGAEEISPLTQLFTEEYMVDYILDNTLGAWYAAKKLRREPDLGEIEDERDVLKRLAVGEVNWKYLSLSRGADGAWFPVAGEFDQWPECAADIKCLDPCMGSGHFVVGMVERLVALRSNEEGISAKCALEKVLKENIFGLELDQRCTQIAAFNIAIYSWKRFGYFEIDASNLGCSGLAPNLSLNQWKAFGAGNPRIENGLEKLYYLFVDAAEKGSLINPARSESSIFDAGFSELKQALQQVIELEGAGDDDAELIHSARGISTALQILAQTYHLVATNPPYLGQLKQNPRLRSWIEDQYSDARSDLSMTMFSRMIDFCKKGGTAAAVLPGEITYQKRLAEFRARILRSYDLNFVVLLGVEAFRTPLRVQPCLLSCTKTQPESERLIPYKEISDKKIEHKDAALRTSDYVFLNQLAQLANPDSSIRAEGMADLPLLSDFVDGLTGITTGASDQFVRKFWEVGTVGSRWELMQTSIDRVGVCSGFSLAILWENESGRLAQYADSVKHLNHVAQNWRRGKPSWGKRGVAISKMGDMGFSPYYGAIYNANCCALIPKNKADLPALWCFISSGLYTEEVRKINKALLVETKYLTKVPFDIDFWRQTALNELPEGVPEPQSDHPTQWLFHGHPAHAKSPLHVAVCRLLGFHWPAEYLDNLNLAPESIKLSRLCARMASSSDQDGIVCIPAIRGENAGAERLREILRIAYESEWSGHKERELLLEAAFDAGSNKPPTSLEDWLRNHFFAEHCKLFNSRPFVWHIWDGSPSGFSALVNYHKLVAPGGGGLRTLQTLAYTYIGDWIDRQKHDEASGIDGASARIAAAQQLQSELIKIIDGEPPYDIFARWKPLHKQPVGWNPDIDDGVRINIRPFVNASMLKQGGKSQVSILRTRIAGVDWRKDRGKEPFKNKLDFPWYWGFSEPNGTKSMDFGASSNSCPSVGETFDGVRWNDLHYTRAAKEAARARHRGEG